jgi:hypothetical protein
MKEGTSSHSVWAVERWRALFSMNGCQLGVNGGYRFTECSLADEPDRFAHFSEPGVTASS